MKKKLTKEEVNILKSNMEAQRKAEYLREKKEANIIKEESVSLEDTYGSELVATMLSIINKYMPPYTKTFKEGEKRQHYIEAGHKLLKNGDHQTAMCAYKKALESGRIKYEDGKKHFDLNFDVEPFLAIKLKSNMIKQWHSIMKL